MGGCKEAGGSSQ